MHPRQLTLEEKQDPLNGTIFIVLKEVVPPELTWAAKRRINIFAGRAGHPFHPHFALESLLRLTLTSPWTVRRLG